MLDQVYTNYIIHGLIIPIRVFEIVLLRTHSLVTTHVFFEALILFLSIQ